MPSKDSSIWTSDKRVSVTNTVSSSITPLKLRAPLSYSRYNPTYKVNLKRTLAEQLLQYTKTVLAGVFKNTDPDLDGIGLLARIRDVHQILYYNNYIYILNRAYQTIRRYNVSTGEVSIFAGQYNVLGSTNGTTLLNSSFFYPTTMTIDSVNNIMYIGTNSNIRAIDLNTNTITTFLNRPASIDQFTSLIYQNGFLYGTDPGKLVVYKIEVSTKTFTIIAGTSGAARGFVDGIGAAARFSINLNLSDGLVFYNDNLYVADGRNNSIRKINVNTTEVTTFFTIPNINSIVLFNGSIYYFELDSDKVNYSFYKIDINTVTKKRLFRTSPAIRSFQVINENLLYVADANNQIVKFSF